MLCLKLDGLLKIQRVNRINYYVENNKSSLVLGPRGTGKSFFLRDFLATYSNYFYIDLLNSVELQKYLMAPELLYKEIETNLKINKQLIVCIDEIQKNVSLFNECHRIIEDFQSKVIFILTGSSARKLKKNKANLLAARALLVSFSNLSYNEISFLDNLDSILQYGLLPVSFIEKKSDLKIDYLKTYVATYLKEEIIDEALTRKVENFFRFLELAAQYNGQIFTYSKLAKELHVDDRTLKTHYEILEDTMIINTIPAWTHSEKRRLQSSSKHYFFDNGVLNAFRGDLKLELNERSFRYGQLFENLMINEIIKMNHRHGNDYKLFHYRTDNGHEIDLILQKNIYSAPIAIEIKSSVSPSIEDVATLKLFRDEFSNATLYCVCRCDRPYSQNGVEFVPYIDFLKMINELMSV